MKFIHAIFLGQDNRGVNKDVGETSWKMLMPLLILSGLCVVLGIFSNSFINATLAPAFRFTLSYGGNWNSIFTVIFISVALIIGFILWNLMSNKRVREDVFFVGGESGYAKPLFPATEFYKTIEDLPLLRRVYRFIGSEKWDIYNILNINIMQTLALN